MYKPPRVFQTGPDELTAEARRTLAEELIRKLGEDPYLHDVPVGETKGWEHFTYQSTSYSKAELAADRVGQYAPSTPIFGQCQRK
jgi:hypothetical protein